jgi:hypothetical protein
MQRRDLLHNLLFAVRPELVEGPAPSVGFDKLNPNGLS